jgi:hypothetical protein
MAYRLSPAGKQDVLAKLLAVRIWAARNKKTLFSQHLLRMLRLPLLPVQTHGYRINLSFRNKDRSATRRARVDG